MLRQLTELDFPDQVGLVLSIRDEQGERLIAVGRFVRVRGTGERAEFAITVADEYQNRGAGTLLLREILRIARAVGVRELVADVLQENTAMLRLIRGSHFPFRERYEGGVYSVLVSLAGD